jgi:hypothetical protein
MGPHQIVMLSAKGREAEVSKGSRVGADAYVTKPFSNRELIAQVARSWGRPPPRPMKPRLGSRCGSRRVFGAIVAAGGGGRGPPAPRARGRAAALLESSSRSARRCSDSSR